MLRSDVDLQFHFPFNVLELSRFPFCSYCLTQSTCLDACSELLPSSPLLLLLLMSTFTFLGLFDNQTSGCSSQDLWTITRQYRELRTWLILTFNSTLCNSHHFSRPANTSTTRQTIQDNQYNTTTNSNTQHQQQQQLTPNNG